MSETDDNRLIAAMLALCEARAPHRSCCPSEVARAQAEDWRPLMPRIRALAAVLQAQGRLRVLQQGREVDALHARGPIRLAAVAASHCVSGDAVAAAGLRADGRLLHSAPLHTPTGTPMSQDATRALLQRYYAAFNAADWNGFLGMLEDDVIHDINQGARDVGKAAFAQFMDRMNRCYSEQIEDIVIMTGGDGSRAAVEFTVVGKYLRTDEGLPEANGQTYRLPGGAFFEIRNGRVARVTNYYNLQDWLKQVGA